MAKLFVAIPVPEEIKGEVKLIMSELPAAQWMPLEKMHLTIRFIGDVPEPCRQEISQIFQKILWAPFNMKFTAPRVFVSNMKQLILYAGVEKDAPLYDLREKIDAELQRTQVPEDPLPLKPHLTLAILGGKEDQTRPELTEYLKRHAGFKSTEFLVSTFDLYESGRT